MIFIRNILNGEVLIADNNEQVVSRGGKLYKLNFKEQRKLQPDYERNTMLYIENTVNNSVPQRLHSAVSLFGIKTKNTKKRCWYCCKIKQGDNNDIR